ncbi:unnamed protein product [Ranitomeya imitator]|uniref:Ubiquitin-like protein 5 n=1 Tax=Ranitomeya imitator TaxID=111125 RepID=A0ABN9LKE4_9NEOB|nr:unnamed protein product [Ranitomeya imitator]
MMTSWSHDRDVMAGPSARPSVPTERAGCIARSGKGGVGLIMIEVVCNDRLGKKVRVKCNSEDTIKDLKKLIAAQTGTRWEKIVLKK